MQENKKMFFRELKIECKKAMKNKMFFFTLLITMSLATLSAMYNISTYQEAMQKNLLYGGNPMIEIRSLYKCWMGADWQSFGSIGFSYLLPLFAALPYGWSYFVENKSGYQKYLMVRGGKRNYFICKYLATFLSGGLVILIPLVYNFLLVAMFVPAIKPDVHYLIYYGISYGTMWSGLFYECPLLYDILYILLDFVFAGLFACMSLACAMILHNRITISVLPFFCMMVLHYGRTFCYGYFYKEISPINFLTAYVAENVTCWWIVLLEGILFFFIPVGYMFHIAKKREIL